MDGNWLKSAMVSWQDRHDRRFRPPSWVTPLTQCYQGPHKRIINWAACGEQGALVASLACKFRRGGGGGGCFWEVVVGVCCPALLNLDTISEQYL